MDISRFEKLNNDVVIPSLYAYFLPGYYSSDVRYCRCGNGFLVFVKCLSWTRCQIIGDIDWVELKGILGGNRVVLYYELPKDTPHDSVSEHMLDFIIDETYDVKKYDTRSNIKKRGGEITWAVDEYISPEEYDLLFSKWVRPGMSKKLFSEHWRWFNNPFAKHLTYRKDGVLFGCQIYLEVAGCAYGLTNVFDFDYDRYSKVFWSVPIHYFEGRVIHDLGAHPGDKKLIAHKERIYHGNCLVYEKVAITESSDLDKELARIREVRGYGKEVQVSD